MNKIPYALSALVLLLMASLPILGINPAQLQTSGQITVALDKKMLSNSGPLYGMTNIFFEDPGAATILRPAGWKDVKLAQIIGAPALKPVNALRYHDESGAVQIAVDTDSDGDWNDEKPLLFQKSGDSTFADFSIRVVASEGSQASPAEVAYQIIQSGSYIYARIREYRTGTLQIGDAIYALLLRPQDRDAPIYGPGRTVFFVDLDRNGEIAQYWEERKSGELVPAEQVSLTQPFLLAGRKFVVESLDAAGTRLVLKPSSADTAVSPGFIAPFFEAPDLEGRIHRLRDLRGRVVLLEFWSVDCPWADTVRPLINALAEKFKGPDFATLSIAREKEPSILREYLKTKPKSTTVLGRDDNVWKTYNPEGMSPLAFVLDRSGVIRLIAPGARSLKALEAVIAGLIASQESTGEPTGRSGDELPLHITKSSDKVLFAWVGDAMQTIRVIALSTARGVVVIDTNLIRSADVRIRQAIEKEFSRKDIKYLINTHSHHDHTAGNQVYADATIIAQETAFEGMKSELTGEGLGKLLEMFKADAQGWAARKDKAAPDSGEYHFFREGVVLLKTTLEELQTGFIPTYPSVLFDKSMTLDMGDMIVELYAVGGTHTTSDIMVFVPEEGLVAVGDVTPDQMLPYLAKKAPWDLGFILENWGRIVEGGREIKHVNMAHTDMKLGVETFKQQYRYLKTLWDGLRELRSHGATLADAKQKYTIERDFPYFKDRRLAIRDMSIHDNNVEAIWERTVKK